MLPCPHGPTVIPYTLSENDMKFVAPNGFTTGDQFFEYLRDHLDYLVREARLGQGQQQGGAVGKLMSVGLHCRVVGRPGRMAGLEKFLGMWKEFPVCSPLSSVLFVSVCFCKQLCAVFFHFDALHCTHLA